MRANIKTFVGLDVHKDSIAIAYASADFSEPPRFLGTTGYSVISLTKALGKIGKPEELSLCHEAGPCGYGLVRSLRQKGYATDVIAPSRVARQPADRIKTDRRDALLLARLLRSAELTPIVVPEPKDEAIRDLVRTREDAMHDRGRARQRLRSFLLRQGHSYTGRRWGPTHQLFLSKIKFADPAHHISFTEYRLAVHVRTECVERLETALRPQVQSWRSLPVVQALMTLRGIDLLSAVTIIAELGDLRRFPHPRELMGYVGLVPSEHSSGPTRHHGGLTKTGNTHVRRILLKRHGTTALPLALANRCSHDSKGSRSTTWQPPGRPRFGFVRDFAGCGPAAFITTRCPRLSPASCAALSGISDGKLL